LLKKLFGGGRVWGVGCGVWGFTSFEVVNYLIFREKVRFIQQTLDNNIFSDRLGRARKPTITFFFLSHKYEV